MAPFSPTAHTSLAELPWMAWRRAAFGSTAVQVVPSQCMAAPVLPPGTEPTAHTSLSLLAQAALRLRRGPGALVLHGGVPFQYSMLPPGPTDQIEFALVPKTLYAGDAVGGDHTPL